jgi:hypothetical protein
MANLQSGTRIYGTANVDTQINVATGNAVINSTGFFVNTFIMASNTYVQTLSPVGYVSNSYASSATGLASNTYLAATFASNTYVQTLSTGVTGVSNSYATATFASNTYVQTLSTGVTGVSNSYATATFTSNNYINNSLVPVSNAYFRAYPQIMIVPMSDEITYLQYITAGSSTVPVMRIQLPYAMTLISPYVRLTASKASDTGGGSIGIDIKITSTGASLFSGAKPSLGTGANTNLGTIPTLSTTTLNDGEQLQFYMTSTGTNALGLKATLYYIRTT